MSYKKDNLVLDKINKTMKHLFPDVMNNENKARQLYHMVCGSNFIWNDFEPLKKTYQEPDNKLSKLLVHHIRQATDLDFRPDYRRF